MSDPATNWPYVLIPLGIILGFAVGALLRGRVYDELRHQRNYLQSRVEALTADLLAMRRDGFSVTKPATVREAPDAEADGLKRAEAQFVVRAADLEFITRATHDIMQKTGVSEAQARAEAIRLRRAVTDEDPPT